MNRQSITYQGAIDAVGATTDKDATNVYQLAGVNPKQILGHTLYKDYILPGVTPREFMAERGATQFDYKELQKRFKSICDDYLNDISMDIKSKAVEFCSRILYEVDPESRQVKKRDGDKVWKFRFIYEARGKLIVKTAFVCTHIADENRFEQTNDSYKIILTVKQACLLALETLERINNLGAQMTEPIYLLTPLSCAVFSKKDLGELAKKCNTTSAVVVNVINSSCQSGGQYLRTSKLHCAVVASVVATKKIKDKDVRDSIISKTIKRYMQNKKEWRPDFFSIYAEYAHGGIPRELSPDSIINAFNSIQGIALSPMQAARNSLSTATTSSVLTPGYSSGECIKSLYTLSGVAIVRPPRHHAEPNKSLGF